MTRHVVAVAASLALAAALGLAPISLAQGERALPEPGMDLPPGRYASDIVGPRIAFSVDEGWQAGPAGPGPIFTLVRASEPGTWLSITRFDGAVFLDSCDPTSLSEVEATVPRLVAVIAGNPYLNPATITPTEVDGHDGLWLDVATPAYTECQLGSLLLFALSVDDGGEFVQIANQQSRFIVVDVDDEVIVLAIESFPGVPFGELLEASLDLVETMTFAPAPAPAPSPKADAVEASSSPDPLPTPQPADPEASPSSVQRADSASAA